MATERTVNRPTHHLYIVTGREGSERGFWTRIGAAWPNADGKGWSLQLTAIPLDGKLVMREPREDSAEGGAE